MNNLPPEIYLQIFTPFALTDFTSLLTIVTTSHALWTHYLSHEHHYLTLFLHAFIPIQTFYMCRFLTSLPSHRRTSYHRGTGLASSEQEEKAQKAVEERLRGILGWFNDPVGVEECKRMIWTHVRVKYMATFLHKRKLESSMRLVVGNVGLKECPIEREQQEQNAAAESASNCSSSPFLKEGNTTTTTTRTENRAIHICHSTGNLIALYHNFIAKHRLIIHNESSSVHSHFLFHLFSLPFHSPSTTSTSPRWLLKFTSTRFIGVGSWKLAANNAMLAVVDARRGESPLRWDEFPRDIAKTGLWVQRGPGGEGLGELEASLSYEDFLNGFPYYRNTCEEGNQQSKGKVSDKMIFEAVERYLEKLKAMAAEMKVEEEEEQQNIQPAPPTPYSSMPVYNSKDLLDSLSAYESPYHLLEDNDWFGYEPDVLLRLDFRDLFRIFTAEKMSERLDIFVENICGRWVELDWSESETGSWEDEVKAVGRCEILVG